MCGPASLFSIEGDRCLLSLVSQFGDRPPTALGDCFVFAESLEAPEISTGSAKPSQAKQAVAGKRFNIPQTRVIWFDQMSGYPLGLLPLDENWHCIWTVMAAAGRLIGPAWLGTTSQR